MITSLVEIAVVSQPAPAERECCLLVSSTPPCIRQPGPRLLQKLARAPLAPEAFRAAHALEAAATVPTLPPAARAPQSVLVLLRSSTNELRKLLLLLLRQRRLLLQLPFALSGSHCGLELWRSRTGKGSSGGRKKEAVCGVGQERLGPSYFFISLVLGPLNSLLWYVPSSRYSVFCIL